MLRVRVCAVNMDGFLGPKFSKKWSLFWLMVHNHGWVIQNLTKSSQRLASKFRQLEEGSFLKTGRQTPVQPQVM